MHLSFSTCTFSLPRPTDPQTIFSKHSMRHDPVVPFAFSPPLSMAPFLIGEGGTEQSASIRVAVVYCIREKRRDPIHFSKTTNRHIKSDGTRRRSERLNVPTTKAMDSVGGMKIEK